MKHSRAILYLEGYAEGELSPRKQQALDDHLAACPECAAHSQESAGFIEFLRVARQAAPAGFEDALRSTHQETLRAARAIAPERSSIRSWIFRPAALVPMAAAAAFTVILVLKPAPTDLDRPPAPPAGLASISAPSPDFIIRREGTQVRVEWPQNGRRHSVSKGNDPVTVLAAARHEVRGKVWSDSGPRPAPGSVTYYLID